VIKLLNADDGAAPGEFSAAEERAAFAFPDDQFATTFIAFDTRQTRVPNSPSQNPCNI